MCHSALLQICTSSALSTHLRLWGELYSYEAKDQSEISYHHHTYQPTVDKSSQCTSPHPRAMMPESSQLPRTFSVSVPLVPHTPIMASCYIHNLALFHIMPLWNVSSGPAPITSSTSSEMNRKRFNHSIPEFHETFTSAIVISTEQPQTHFPSHIESFLFFSSHGQSCSYSSYGNNQNADFMMQSAYSCRCRDCICHNGRFRLGRGFWGQLLRTVLLKACMQLQKCVFPDLASSSQSCLDQYFIYL